MVRLRTFLRGIIKGIVDKNRSMIGWETTPASEYLKEAYKPREKTQDLVAG